MNFKVFVVFCSPAGSTRHVAEIIKEEFNERNAEVVVLDLGKQRDFSATLEALKAAGAHACLFIGSPVYRDVTIPPVIKFIETLPKTDGACAVPFVTWGKACSGVALWQMGHALMKKGFSIVGAAKVVAVHSIMWRLKNPVGKGRPDKTDNREIKKLVAALYHRLYSDNISMLSLDTLDYQLPARAKEMKKKISAPWMIIPKHVNAETCTQCGICEEECPVSAVALNPYPEFNQTCFDCFNCIRLCPEAAIEPAISMDQIEQRIRERVRTINEQPLTQIFL